MPMRRRLPLLRLVLLLIAALVIAAIGLLGFVRVPRITVAPGSIAFEPLPRHDAHPLPHFRGVIEARDRGALRLGQSAAIRLNAYPWMQKGTLSARVTALGDTALNGGGYPVILSVDSSSSPGPLMNGLQGEARIATGETESLGRLLFSHRDKDPH